VGAPRSAEITRCVTAPLRLYRALRAGHGGHFDFLFIHELLLNSKPVCSHGRLVKERLFSYPDNLLVNINPVDLANRSQALTRYEKFINNFLRLASSGKLPSPKWKAFDHLRSSVTKSLLFVS